jgi:hypothetical protein
MEQLPKTLGFTAEELKNHYQQNKELYKSSITLDSTGRDSTWYQTYDEAAPQVAEALFIKKYPPDSLFLSRFSANLEDTATIHREWINFIRDDLMNFFMKEYFKQQYGKPYPDSLSEIYGTGKVIAPEDMNVIMSWVSEERREYYSSESAIRELVDWLLKWKLFALQAEKSGITNTPEMKKIMNWALKIDVVEKYIETELDTKLQEGFTVDTPMVTYSIYDDAVLLQKDIDPNTLTEKINELKKLYKTMRYDGILFDMRKKAGVTFYQSDYKDERDQNPTDLLHKADSLRDTGIVNEAENVYSTLTQNFLFSAEGKTALLEIAKLQTERQIYQQAISNYRKHLLLVPDDGKRCNTFFMIAFIFDEHLNEPDKAQINYKWILKNTPGCDLTDDAEFMMLHLDEPMSSVEELRAEALRQGRKIESFEESEPVQDSATTQPAKTAN